MSFCRKCERAISSDSTSCINCGTTANLTAKLTLTTPENNKSHNKINSARTTIAIILSIIILSAIFAPSENKTITETTETPLKDKRITTIPSPNVTQTYENKEDQTPSRPNISAKRPSTEDVREYSLYALDWFFENHCEGEQYPVNDEIYKFTAIYYFVYSEIEYVDDPHGDNYYQSPSQTLRYSKGDCDDRALLMAAMCESVGLDAAVNLVDTSGDEKIDHMLCSVYFPEDSETFSQKQNELLNTIGLYQSEFRFSSYREPSKIIIKVGEDWTHINKYNNGIWVTLEEWSQCTSYYRYDIDYSTVISESDLQELFDVMTKGTTPQILFNWKTNQQGYTLYININIENKGAVTAKSVKVWVKFDAGNDQCYDHDISTPFDLSPNQNHLVTLQLVIPKNVNTRIVVRVYGDNFQLITSEGDWLHT